MDMGFSKALQQANFKRKFRWTLRIDSPCVADIGEQTCKTGNRPNIDLDEQQIDYLNARMWIPGKATLETLEFTFFDVCDNTTGELLGWLAQIYDFQHPVELGMESDPTKYEGTGTLNLYDGCGGIMDTWKLLGMWPKTINFGDLDMSSAEECTISVTFRYRNLEYIPGCCGALKDCECSPCG